MSGQGELGPHGDPARPVEVEAGRACELRSELGGGDARGPHGRSRGDAARPRRPGRIATESRATSTTVCPTSGVTPSCSSERAAFRDSDSGKPGRTRSEASTSRTRAVRVSIERKSRGNASWASSAIWPGHLDPGRPGADDDEGQPVSPFVGVALDLGRLERGQDAVPDLERAGQRLQLRGVLLPLVVAEVGVPRAPGDDQRVVAEDGPSLAVGQVSSTTSRRSMSTPVTSASTTRVSSGA